MALRGTPASICFPMALLHGAHCQEHLRISAPACHIFQMALRCSAPASNKPHPAERSTPVWLAIWRIWAGFANSQHRNAAFATPDNICAHSSLLQTLSSCSDRRKSVGPSALIAYATSVSPPDEAAAWPGAAFLQITFHAGCRHTHFWQGVAWMVRPICAHRAQLQKLIVWL